MVDEDAGQLVADRLVDQHRRDRAVDPARQAADDPAGADLLANLGDLGGPELGHRPVAGEAADVADEIGEQPAAVRRVHHFGMEHQAEEAPRLVGGDGIRRAFGLGDDLEAVGKRLDPVAVAHPDLVPLARLQRPSNSIESPTISMKARPNSRLSDGATLPPSWCAMVCWP